MFYNDTESFQALSFVYDRCCTMIFYPSRRAWGNHMSLASKMCRNVLWCFSLTIEALCVLRKTHKAPDLSVLQYRLPLDSQLHNTNHVNGSPLPPRPRDQAFTVSGTHSGSLDTLMQERNHLTADEENMKARIGLWESKPPGLLPGTVVLWTGRVRASSVAQMLLPDCRMTHGWNLKGVINPSLLKALVSTLLSVTEGSNTISTLSIDCCRGTWSLHLLKTNYLLIPSK